MKKIQFVNDELMKLENLIAIYQIALKESFLAVIGQPKTYPTIYNQIN